MRIDIAGTAKEGKSTIAALIYALLGDYGIEADVVAYDERQIRQLARGDPKDLVERVRKLASGGVVVSIAEKQLPKNWLRKRA